MKGQQDWRLWVHYHYYLARAMLVGVAGVLLILIGILPMIHRFMATRAQLKAEETKLKAVSDKIVIADNLDPNIVESRVKLLDKILPPTKDVVTYLNTINFLAKELNLSLGDVSLSPGLVYQNRDSELNKHKKPIKRSENRSWHDLETELKIIGSQDNIYTFLKRIENMAPLMVMKDVQIAKAGQTGESFVLSLKLGMVYAEPELTTITKQKVTLLNRDDEKLLDKLKTLKGYTVVSENQSGGKSELRKNLFNALVEPKPTNQFLRQQMESSPSAQSSQSAQLK